MFGKKAISSNSGRLPYAVNCAEYEEQIFGTVKTPKKPVRQLSTTMCQ